MVLADAIRRTLGQAWIADSYDSAAAASRSSVWPIATPAGELFRGPHLVSGGKADESRGILEMKREIADLARAIDAERNSLVRLAEETAGLEGTIAHSSSAIAALNTEHHSLEKTIVALEAQLERAAAELARLTQKGEQLALERRQAEEERDGLDGRQSEARASITRLEQDQHGRGAVHWPSAAVRGERGDRGTQPPRSRCRRLACGTRRAGVSALA